MEKYTWGEFILVILILVIIYYAIIFYKYYYPYMDLNKKGGVQKKNTETDGESSDINHNHITNEPEANPFIKQLDKKEKKTLVEENNINNINNSNNFNNFSSENESANSSDTLSSLFTDLPVVEETTIEEYKDISVEPEIDLTKYLPVQQDVEYLEMNVTNYSEEIQDNESGILTDKEEVEDINSDESNEEVDEGIYLNNDAEQMTFEFDNDLSTIENSEVKNKDNSIPDGNQDDENTVFDFNN